MPKSIFDHKLKGTIEAGIMTEQQTHFKSADLIASESLEIALEKEKAAHQETKDKLEAMKFFMRKFQHLLNEMDLLPAMKDKNGMDSFKGNK